MFDSQEETTIPKDLDEMAPGPDLAAALGRIDLDGLSARDRVTTMRAHSRMASHYRAQTYRDMAAVADHMHHEEEELRREDPFLAWEQAWAFAAAEIRAALCLTRRAADAELGLALDLRDRLP